MNVNQEFGKGCTGKQQETLSRSGGEGFRVNTNCHHEVRPRFQQPLSSEYSTLTSMSCWIHPGSFVIKFHNEGYSLFETPESQESLRKEYFHSSAR